MEFTFALVTVVLFVMAYATGKAIRDIVSLISTLNSRVTKLEDALRRAKEEAKQ